MIQVWNGNEAEQQNIYCSTDFEGAWYTDFRWETAEWTNSSDYKKRNGVWKSANSRMKS